MNKRRERPPLSDRGRRRALRTWGFYLLALTAWVTVVLAAVLYLGQEVYAMVALRDNVANFMHIVGGVCGTVFGYVNAGPRRRRRH